MDIISEGIKKIGHHLGKSVSNVIYNVYNVCNDDINVIPFVKRNEYNNSDQRSLMSSQTLNPNYQGIPKNKPGKHYCHTRFLI